MVKLLFVIDNVFLYENLKAFIESHTDRFELCDFCHSPLNSPLAKHTDFLNQDRSIDVRRDASKIWSNYDVVFSIHCFQFFPKELVQKVLCVNLHPGYNPLNRGWFPQVFAIIHGRDSGATLHVMDEKLDNGLIIDRAIEPIRFSDTSLDVYTRVLNLELKIFKNNFDSIITRKFIGYEPETMGYLYTKNDFNILNEIELDREGTFKQFYDLLRAQTHGNYKNAYVIDPDTGDKYFLKLTISKSSDA